LPPKIKGWNAFQFERVGLNLRPELVALKDANGDAAAFAKLAKLIAETSEFNLILMSESPDVLKAGGGGLRLQAPAPLCRHGKYGGCLGCLAKEMDLPLAVKADSVEALVPLTTKLTEMGLKDLVLDAGIPRCQKIVG
jgi:acetyl-CoA decarbonylase/synthase complex subunit gamma